MGPAALHGRFAHGDLASILNATTQRTTTHAANETTSLTQGTSVWAAIGDLTPNHTITPTSDTIITADTTEEDAR